MAKESEFLNALVEGQDSEEETSSFLMDLVERETRKNVDNAIDLLAQVDADITRLQSKIPSKQTSYYSRPVDIDVAESDEVWNRVESLSFTLENCENQLRADEQKVTSAASVLEKASAAMMQSYVTYESSPTREAAEAYSQASDAYKKACEEYKQAYDQYTQTYNTVKRIAGGVEQIYGAWNQYVSDYQDIYDNWRSTIRDPTDVKQEMDRIDAQISNAQSTGKGGYKTGVGIVDDAVEWVLDKTGLQQVVSWGSGQVNVELLRRQKERLQEEYDWGKLAQLTDIQNTPYFGSLSKEERLLVIDITEIKTLPEEDREKLFDWFWSKNNGGKELSAWADAFREANGENRLKELESSWRRYQNEKHAQDTVAKAEQAADGIWGGIWTSVAGRAANLWSSITSPLAVAQELLWYDDRYGNLDPNGPGFQTGIWANAAQSKVTQNIAGDVYDENGKLVSEGGFWRDALATVYSSGMSASDSLARLALGMAMGGGSTVSLGLAAMGSFGDTVQQISDQGGNPIQAIGLGIINAGFEVLTEKYSVENLFRVMKGDPLSGKKILKEMFKQGAIEITEEEINFLASTLAEAAIMQDKSSYQIRVKELMTQGVNESEAREIANKELLQQAGDTAIQSFLSGMIMTGVTGATQKAQYGISGKQLGLNKVSLEDAQAIIDSGLESGKDTAAYKMAVKLQKKLKVGKIPTASELYQQLAANEQAIQEEQKDGVADVAEGTTAAKSTIGADVGIHQKLKSEEITMIHQKADDALRTGAITQKDYDDLMLRIGRQDLAEATVESTAGPVQIQQEEKQNGGVQYEYIDRESAGFATAQPAGEHGSQTGGGLLYGSGQRNVGAGTGKQTGSLDGITETSTQRTERLTGASRIKAAVARQNLARSLRLPKVSGRDIGLIKGTERRGLQVLPQEHWDRELQILAQKIWDETGLRPVFVVGDIYVQGEDKQSHRIRAAITAEQVILQADYTKVSLNQILDHEIYHYKRAFVQEGGYNLDAMNAETILQQFSEAEYIAVLDAYLEALDGQYGLSEAQNLSTQDAYNEIVTLIKEEMMADAYAGINAFGAGADKFTKTVNERMGELNLGKKTSQENGVRQTNGPNENTAQMDGERYSANDAQSVIYPDMEDAQRIDILLRKKIYAPHYDSSDPITGAKILKLKGMYITEARSLLTEIARQCGDFRTDLHDADIELSFAYSNKSLKESVNKQTKRSGNAESFGKMLTVLPEICENAVEIEAHTDRYVETARADGNLKEMHILVGAFMDGGECVPVQLEVKEYIPEAGMLNKLYVTVTMKNEAGVTPRISNADMTIENARSRPASIISLAELIANVKDDTGSLVKYLPDQMLTEEQKQAKEKALAEDEIRLGDMRYEFAVEQGNLQKAQTMLSEKAEKAGYSASDDWRMNHHAPNRSNGVTIDNADEVYGGDGSIRSPLAHQYYGEGRKYDIKAIVALHKAWRDPEGSITVFRAVPTGVEDSRLRNGDWVSPTREYAQEHGERYFEGGFRIIEQKVPVKHLYVDGNSIHEFGYDNGRDSEVYKNIRNNVKLAEVTYDNKGNLIPISQRFDENTADERYSTDDDGMEVIKTDKRYELDETEYHRVKSEMEAKDKQWRDNFLYNELGEKGAERYKATQKMLADREKAERVQHAKENRIHPDEVKLDVESRATEAKRMLEKKLLQTFSIPDGLRSELRAYIGGFADRIVKHGALTEDDRRRFFSRMYGAGAVTIPADDYYGEARSYIKGGHIYVPGSVVAEFGDDWHAVRRRAFAAGIYLTYERTDKNGYSVSGIDVWNSDLAAELPGLFDAEDTDETEILQKIIHVAELGKDEKISLAEYVARVAKEEYTSENDVLDSLERQMRWALESFAETAKVEIQLKDRNLRRVMKERQENLERAQRAKDRRELQELQQKTLKSLQWLNENRRLAPEELREEWNRALSDIDLYAVGAANEMNWSNKYQATWKDLAEMYKEARDKDPNFHEDKEIERIISRLDDQKIADMDPAALMNLYKLATGLRTAFYNRNNLLNDEQYRIFEEVYSDSKEELTEAGKGKEGLVDRFLNREQLSAMNVLERMAGWNPNSAWYSMAKQLERGERDVRAFTMKANRILEEYLNEHKNWVMKADGQGKDAIWYTIEVPELMEWGKGNKPIFGDAVTVYMTPAQKVHMYLESKNLDNLRHMEGGRTFIVDKELYGKGKRQEALEQGRTIRLAPETVKQLVSDLTDEEMELAQVLDQYYNGFATGEINRVSNVLYGYDKAMGKHYAPIYTNQNYTNAEFGTFDVTAEGVGNMKGRVLYSKNPSYNISAFDAFERNVNQTARFVGMAIPIRNWTTLMNWREYKNSMRDTITHAWGLEHKRYIENLLTDLQSGKLDREDVINETGEKLLSNYISSVFGANMSIVLKQMGSIPLAGAYLGVGNVVPGRAQVERLDHALIGKYTQELAWRGMGYSMPETKQLKDHPNWTQNNKAVRFAIGGGAITAMDQWAASVLWPWAENKVRKEYPNLEVGTPEQVNKGESPFYKKVAEEFENAVARSQSTSDQMHQGTLRKSKNTLTRMFTMFTSDSAQTYNTLRQMIGEAGYYKKTGQKEKAKKLSRAAGAAWLALLLNALWGEGVNLLAALIKNKGKKYRDEEGEMTALSILKQMSMGVLSSLSGTVIGGDTLLDMIAAKFSNEKFYAPESMEVSLLQDMYYTVDNAMDIIFGTPVEMVIVALEGGDIGEYFKQNGNDLLGRIKDAALEIASYWGIPAANVEAYIVGALKFIPGFGAVYDGWFESADKSALGGLTGENLSVRVGSLLDQRGIDASEATADALAELYENGFTGAVPGGVPDSVTIDGDERSLNIGQQQHYGNVWADVVAKSLDKIISSERFAEASPDIQEGMLKRLYSYASEQAKASMFDDFEPGDTKADIASYEQAGLDVADYFAVKAEGHNTDEYLEAVVHGLPEHNADNLMDEIAELEPMAGEDRIVDVQKWRTCVDMFSKPMYQLAGLASYMTDAQFAKAKAADDFGIALSDFVRLYEIRSEYDENGNQSFSNAEYKNAIDSLRLSEYDSAVLWQLFAGSKSAKNNPYSITVGQKVLDALAD